MSDARLIASPWERMRGHWSAATWLRTIHVMTGVPIALFAAAALAGLALASIVFVWTVVVPVAGLALTVWLLPWLTRLQRARFAAFLEVEIPPMPAPERTRHPWRWLSSRMRADSTWRQLTYHLLSPLISLVGFVAVILAWAACLVAAWFAVESWVSGEERLSVPLLAITLGLLVTAPWLARGVTDLDLLAARALLGPSRNDELARRVVTLEESRADVIAAADAERRRIERDLHDGPQQRLVSLAMHLGMVRATLTDLPEPATRMIAQAHEEAKQALKELRDFVRGLHPAVLTDEGLDAALSGLAARSPFPVRLHVDVPERPAPAVEAVAFFVVSEALTNVAKHAEVTSAEVMVWRDGDLLRVVVSDDGRGGADPERGTGLRGLTQRVGSVDGALFIESPKGGGTTITAELPCG